MDLAVGEVGERSHPPQRRPPLRQRHRRVVRRERAAHGGAGKPPKAGGIGDELMRGGSLIIAGMIAIGRGFDETDAPQSELKP